LKYSWNYRPGKRQ